MQIKITELLKYLQRHKYYIPTFVNDFCKIIWWKITKKQSVVITTGSGGVGDYLWMRSYMPILKQNGYKVVLIAMYGWKEIVEAYDANNYDIVRFFESCNRPKRIESLFFRIVKCNVFISFSNHSIVSFVHCKKEYNDSSFDFSNTFYEKRNNIVFEQFLKLPSSFCHSIPIIKPDQKIQSLFDKKYVVLTEGGNTHGKLTDLQLKSIISCLIDFEYRVLFNGDVTRLNLILSEQERLQIIDGRTVSFPSYSYAVKKSSFVVTVNTSIYHFALLLKVPAVIISPYEPRTVYINDPLQQYVFSDKGKVIENSSQRSNKEKNELLVNTDPDEIISAIRKMHSFIERIK